MGPGPRHYQSRPLIAGPSNPGLSPPYDRSNAYFPYETRERHSLNRSGTSPSERGRSFEKILQFCIMCLLNLLYMLCVSIMRVPLDVTRPDVSVSSPSGHGGLRGRRVTTETGRVAPDTSTSRDGEAPRPHVRPRLPSRPRPRPRAGHYYPPKSKQTSRDERPRASRLWCPQGRGGLRAPTL